MSKVWPYLIILLAVCVFFWKIFFQGMVAVPGDLMTGAYYPWAEYHYGYTVSVPIKNPLISDSFSQFFVWKKLIADSYKSHSWPLWNPYSYSGYPLLANFHSASLYPLNILFLINNFNLGWNLYVASGVLLSIVAMFLLLKNYDYPTAPSLIGAISYGFCGFQICWLEFATAGQAMIWLPILILLVEKYFSTKKNYWILFLAPILFLLTTAGHFQIAVYGFSLTAIYFIFKLFSTQKNSKDRLKSLIYFTVANLFGLAFSAIQILPTLEMSPLSVRYDEIYIANQNFGLMPFIKSVTLFAPDYFGNPTTANYWGFLNYHETILYGGIAVVFAIVWSIYNFKKNKGFERFFLIVSIFSLVLAFDNPLGRLIYVLKVPFLDTSSAGRMVAVFTFSSSLLIASFLTKIKYSNLTEIIRFFWGLVLYFALVVGITIGIRAAYIPHNVYLASDINNITISIRNLLLPGFLIFGVLTLLLFRRKKFFYVAFGLLVVFDLFRFGWKYEPFVPQKLVFPDTPITNFLKQQPGVFRVDKERGPLLPPNTWTFYGLMSPSGYDPMSLDSYSKSFFKDLNGNDDISSRYAEIDTYNPISLGNYNVKYILVIKRDKLGLVPGNLIYYKIDQTKWIRVFETPDVAVLENSDYKERAFLENDDKNSSNKVEIAKYSPEKVVINYTTDKDDSVVLTDTYYPGWTATVNGTKTKIEVYNKIFRKVGVPKGTGTVEFSYYPKSFMYGLYIAIAALVMWIGTLITMRFVKKG